MREEAGVDRKQKVRKKRKGTKILSYHCKVYENISLLIQKELVDLYNKNFD